MESLVIVESPTKARTIAGFLGPDFKIEPSYGHVRDLPKSKLGVDVGNNFAPQYIIPKASQKHVTALKKLAAKSKRIILATDEDREGEAIAWHISEIFRAAGIINKPENLQRIAFHEITEQAIKNALKYPRDLDINLVNAQQARRILDRLVGYELSPFLWRKIRYGLSAGRVQSVAVRLIVEREREIQNFKKDEYWSIEGKFSKDGQIFTAKLHSIDDKLLGKMDIKTKDDAEIILKNLNGSTYIVSNIAVKQVTRNPSPPFTTSTLQQEATRKLGFSAKQTMSIAQQLYENGHITYMRTDSLNLSSTAMAQARDVIRSEFGGQYALDKPRHFSNKIKGAQEAHEAIRPTNLKNKTDKNFKLQDRGQKNLYELIWKRTIASQMQPALLEQTAVDIETVHLKSSPQANKYLFRANGQVVIFDGFIRVYTEGHDDRPADEKNEYGLLPRLEIGNAVEPKEIKSYQHFTEPPPRYTDASLVKALEMYGIGRPSTYAPILSTIQERRYVEKIEKKYQPTEIGILVNDMLVANFPEIVDINFTSHVEEELDEIAEGKRNWTDVCREFYEPFKKELIKKEVSVEKQVSVSNVPCPHCGKPMLIKFGKMGKFLACPDPESKVTLPMPEEAEKIRELQEKTKDERCPICGKPMVVKRGRFGYFLGCTDYPKCKGVKKIWSKTGFKCPNCMDAPERRDDPGDIVERKSRGKIFYGCTRFPDCKFIINKKPKNEAELQEFYKAWKIKQKLDKTKHRS
jgi:DNA topoisomerase-1